MLCIKTLFHFFELAQKVGWKNNESLIDSVAKDFLPVPCHRVVNSSGKMGANFGLGGPLIQEKMLKEEGIEIKNGKVDLNIYSVNEFI